MQAWLNLDWYLLANWPAWILFGAMLVAAALLSPRRTGRQEPKGVVFLLVAWTASFGALHVLTSVQPWDRYLLPLVLPLVLLVGWAGTRVGRFNDWRQLAGTTLLILALLPAAVQAADGGLPLGGDHGAYGGLDHALAWVDTAVPTGGVLYHRELGWQARFYLFDAVDSGRIELRWFPNAVYLADNATKAPHKPKFLVVADWAPIRDLALHLAGRRLELRQRLRTGHFTVYEIAQQREEDTTWRICRLRSLFPVLISPSKAATMCVRAPQKR